MKPVAITHTDFHNTAPGHHFLPDGELVMFRHCKGGSFEISLKIVGQDGCAAEDFLNDLGTMLNDIASNDCSVQDVKTALYKFAEWKTYFTTWRHQDKLVPASDLAAMQLKLTAMQGQLDYANATKLALQLDNEAANMEPSHD